VTSVTITPLFGGPAAAVIEIAGEVIADAVGALLANDEEIKSEESLKKVTLTKPQSIFLLRRLLRNKVLQNLLRLLHHAQLVATQLGSLGYGRANRLLISQHRL